ncbi:A/G-specific adenine glycosylase [Agrilactobacillus fermenti]|uniref:A/G-specific adenine glycosylase n=1 Tax=Agrilactobacillus fermenti TaxID=2586909 RepID=UPI003A5BDB43
MNNNEIKALQSDFLNWYDQNKRPLPWRENQEPYYVWLSEIMLQQTQVQTVMPYFERFIQALPTLADLAQVPDDTLMKLWEGLGYYSRARNLKRAAQQIMTDYHGTFPQTAAELEQIIGIGPYTAGAIASIAFGEAVPAVDGNAYRVFSRLFDDTTDISKSSARQHFANEIAPLVPKERPGDFNQAVMDLGSSICTTKDPACLLCPLQPYCQAYAQGKQLERPVKTKKIKKKREQYLALVIHDEQGRVLLQERPAKGVLSGLYTYPLINEANLLSESQKVITSTQIAAFFKAQYELTLQQVQLLPVKPVTHIFTHLHWQLTLYTASIDANANLAYFPGRFFTTAAIAAQGLPTLQKKLQARFAAYQKNV